MKENIGLIIVAVVVVVILAIAGVFGYKAMFKEDQV